MKRTTIFLPDELHEELRQEAFRSRMSMAQAIRLRLEARRGAKQRRRSDIDPLLDAAGICSGPTLSANIDEELYGN